MESIQPLDGLSNESFSQIEVDDIFILNRLEAEKDAKILGDLEVGGDIIVSGDQVFSGNQAVTGSLRVDGGLRSFSGFTATGPIYLAGPVVASGGITGPTGYFTYLVVQGITGGTGSFSSLSAGSLSTGSLTGSTGSFQSLLVGSLTGSTGYFDSLTVSNLSVGGAGLGPSFIRGQFSGTGGVVYDSTGGVFSLSHPYVRGLFTAGSGLTYNSTTGRFDVNPSSSGFDWGSILSGTLLLGAGSMLGIGLASGATPRGAIDIGSGEFWGGVGHFAGALYATDLILSGVMSADSLGTGTKVAAGNITSGKIPVVRGGSNNDSFTHGRLLYYNGTSAAFFSGTGLHFDSTNSRLGINNIAPTAALDVTGNAVVSGTLTASGVISGSSLGTGTAVDASSVTTGRLAIARGGTNSGAFTDNKLLYYSASAGAIVGNSAYHVDPLNARLGLNTSTPQNTLDVNGSAIVSGTTTTGALSVTNAATVGSLVIGTTGIQPYVRLQLSGSTGAVYNNSTGVISVDPAYVRAQHAAGTNTTYNTTTGAFDITDVTIRSKLSGTTGAVYNSTTGVISVDPAYVRAQHVAGTNTTYNTTTGAFDITDATIRSKLSAGSGIGYNATTGVISNTSQTQWGPTGSYLAYAGRVQIDYNAGPTGTVPVSNLLLSNGAAGSEAWLSFSTKNASGTGAKWHTGVDASQTFTISKETSTGSILPAVTIQSLPTSLGSMFVNTPLSISSTTELNLQVSSNFNGTGTNVATFSNTNNGKDAFITISNSNTTPSLANALSVGVDTAGNCLLSDKNNTALMTFNQSGLLTSSPQMYLPASSGAWNAPVGKGLFMRYSTAGTNDGAYIQSIDRSNSTIYPLNLEASAVNLNANSVGMSMATTGGLTLFTSSGSAKGIYQSFSCPTASLPTRGGVRRQTVLATNTEIEELYDCIWNGTNYTSMAANDASLGTAKPCFRFMKDPNSFRLETATVLRGSTFSAFTPVFTVPNNGCFMAGTNDYALSTNSGYPVKFVASGSTLTDFIATFNDTYSSSGARGVLFTRQNTIIGAVRYNSGGVAFETSSDYRLKDNIRDYTGGLDVIRKLRPVHYTWKVDGAAAEGFIAHEVQEACPFAVAGKKDQVFENGDVDPQSVNFPALITPLVSATQEMDKRLANIEDQVTSLGGVDVSALLSENETLKQRVDSLETQVKDLIALLRKKFVI